MQTQLFTSALTLLRRAWRAFKEWGEYVFVSFLMLLLSFKGPGDK